MRPLLSVSSGEDASALIVCGTLVSRKSDTSIVATEFDVLECGSSTPLLQFEATERCEVSAENGKLIVTQLGRWPFGPGWKWVDVPLRRFVAVPGSEDVTEKLLLDAPKLTPDQTAEVEKEFERHKRLQDTETEDLVELIGRVFAAALAGSVAGRNALEHMNEVLPWDQFNAEAVEVYVEAVELYNAYAKTSKKVRPIRPLFKP